MKFYMRDWNKTYPIDNENVTRFAYAKIAYVDLAHNLVVITWKGIGTYVKERGFQLFFFINSQLFQ